MIVQGINDSHLLSMKITDEIIKDKAVIGTFIKNTAEISAINLNHAYNALNNTYMSIQSFGTWFVEEISDNESDSQIKIKLSDLSKKFDIDYEDTFNFPATLKQWATWIGTKVGVPLSGAFPNEDVVLSKRPYIGDAPTYREAVKKIAKYAGSYARINRDNTYSFRWFNSTTTVIEDFISFEHGDETTAVNTLVLSTGITNDNIEYPETPVQNPVEIRIDDDFNYLDRFDLLVDIYNQVNGFKYVPIKKLETPYGLLNVRAGDKISCQDMERNDIVTFISSNTLQWQGGLFDDVNSWQSTLKMSELDETKTDHKKAQTIKNQLLDVRRQADKNKGDIQDLITATDDLNEWSTEVDLALESIVAEVRKKPTITVENDGTGTVLLENVAPVKLAYLSVHPTNTDIIGLFVSNDLIIHSGLKIRSMKVKFVGSKNAECKVPKNLYYYSSEIYDEYIFDGNEEKAYVIRKVSIDAQGNKSPLAETYTEECEYHDIILGSGDYEINMPSYPSAYISVKAMMQNEYTDSFATKYELISRFEAIIDKINLSVKRLVDKRQIIAALNLAIRNGESIIEAISNKFVVDSDNFKLSAEGNMECNNARINGNLVTANGVLTNLTFEDEIWNWFNEGGFDNRGIGFIGFNTDNTYQYAIKSFMVFDIKTPDDFVVSNATIHLKHWPTLWWNTYGTDTRAGSCQNMKVYIMNINNSVVNCAYNSDFEIDLGNYTFTPINNISQFSFSDTTYQEKDIEIPVSMFENNQSFKIAIMTTIPTPSWSRDETTAYRMLGPYTGVMSGLLEITGYMKYNPEEQRSVQVAELQRGGNNEGPEVEAIEGNEEEPLNIGEPNEEEESDR